MFSFFIVIQNNFCELFFFTKVFFKKILKVKKGSVQNETI